MEPYSFWQDFFATYRSSPDAIKALWLIVPPAFVIALTWVLSKASANRREPHGPSFAIESRASENAMHNRGNEQVLILAAGRLLDQFEVPVGPDVSPRL
ncbi:MAG: hypothetical protein QM744_17070 [Mesorhizobium sp.]